MNVLNHHRITFEKDEALMTCIGPTCAGTGGAARHSHRLDAAAHRRDIAVPAGD